MSLYNFFNKFQIENCDNEHQQNNNVQQSPENKENLPLNPRSSPNNNKVSIDGGSAILFSHKRRICGLIWAKLHYVSFIFHSRICR